MSEVAILLDIIQGMKPRDKQQCIKKLRSILSKNNLDKSSLANKWLEENGFLEMENYIS
tara:strand:+ start:412 stop:588 length:177 start_codon:yes stop_codon:yes gene_type:complete